jgi:hypothetical protein
MPHLSDKPRPEYPRPDRQRAFIDGVDWLNLNGPWQFRFDADRVGVDERWFEHDASDWREQIIVPFCWESLAAWGEADAAGNDNYYATRVFRNPLEVTTHNHRSAARYEVGWYRRRVTIPRDAAWAGKHAILTIGAADFATDCWCNGVHIGRNEGGYAPFEFDLTDAVAADGSALLVFRVEDPMDNAEQPVGKQWRWYTTVSGIWQTVFVEPRGASFIQQFRITTDVKTSSVALEVSCQNAPAGFRLEVEITPPEGAISRFAFDLRDGAATELIAIEPLMLWDPTDPKLYDAILSLANGDDTHDVVHTYFGMRSIETAARNEAEAPSALSLNGEPIYLRGALYQSYFADGVYTATDARTLRNDIIAAKNAGFDFLRVHIKIDEPLLLYYADTMGILLMVDIPNFGEGGDTPLGRERFETLMRRAIQRDFNHPSIIAWCLFNETWGFGGQLEIVELINKTEVTAPAREGKVANVASATWVKQMWELAKRLDPTRLIEDMSVVQWEHVEYYGHGETDINSWHFYINDYEQAKAHIDQIVAQTRTGSTLNYTEGFHQGSQPLINSEYGGVGALDGDRDVSWSFKFLTNELRRQPNLSAYIYTELHDVEWECNGFLNYDRTPKEFGYDPTIINRGDVLPVDAPPVRRRIPGERFTVDVASSHYSRRPSSDVTLHWRLSGIDSLGNIHTDVSRGWVPIEFPHRRVAHAHSIAIQTPPTPMLCTLSIQALEPQGRVVAENFVQCLSTAQYPQPREEIACGVVLRGHPADWSSANWNAGISDRELSRDADFCYGGGAGFYEWTLPLQAAELRKARRLRVLCEASSCRPDHPQTDVHRHPTRLKISLNHVRVYEATVPDHPHDSRGVLSYLRGHYGAYGYLIHAFVEGELLRNVIKRTDEFLRLRFRVPANGVTQGGLTIYGAECGRYPLCPTVVIEW